MSNQESMAKLVASLDWADADASHAPELGVTAELLRSRLGDGVLRWMLGSVEDSLASLRKRVRDPLVSQSKVRILGQHILTNILLDLSGDDAFPNEQRVIDRELASDFVARTIAVSDIVDALRHMQRDWLARLIGASMEVDPDATGLIADLAGSVTRTVDAWVGALIEAMIQEQHRVAESEQFRIRTAIEALISGAPVDTAATSTLLRRPLSGWHQCCVIGVRDGAFVDKQRIGVVAGSMSRLAGGSPPLRYETSEGETYLWTTTENAPMLISAGSIGISSPLVAGVGEAHRGVVGFRRSYLEADGALQHALRMDVTGGLIMAEAVSMALMNGRAGSSKTSSAIWPGIAWRWGNCAIP